MTCPNCPDKDKCLNDSEFKTITDRVSILKYEMTNKFTQQRYLISYKERFHVSEGINGYLKNTNGISHLLGSNQHSVTNETHLKNTIYNLTRIKKPKKAQLTKKKQEQHQTVTKNSICPSNLVCTPFI
jgi:hypothetical protein